MQTSGSARILYHIEELDEQSGFVIAPFHVSKQHPIVLIRSDIQKLPPDEETKVSYSMPAEQEFHHSETLVSFLENPKEDYSRPFQCLHRTATTKAVRETRAVALPDDSGRQSQLLPCCRFPQGNRTVQIFICLSLPYYRDRHMAGLHARNHPLRRERKMAYGRPCRHPTSPNGELPIEWDDKKQGRTGICSLLHTQTTASIRYQTDRNSSDPGTRRRTVAFEKRLQLSTAR